MPIVWARREGDLQRWRRIAERETQVNRWIRYKEMEKEDQEKMKDKIR